MTEMNEVQEQWGAMMYGRSGSMVCVCPGCGGILERDKRDRLSDAYCSETGATVALVKVGVL